MHDLNREHNHNWTPTQARKQGIPVIGIGGPVGSGKTALVEALCQRLRDRFSLAAVTNDIFTCLNPKQSGDVALLIGTNKDESTMFASRRLRMVPSNAKALEKEFLCLISPEQQKRITAAYAAYPRKRGVLDLLTDAVFRIPAVRVADCQSVHSPVYMYRFEWNSFLLKLAGLRSFHGLEIPFVFGNNEGRNGKLLRLIASKKRIKSLTGQIQQSWINFAHYRSPNKPDTNNWKAYDSKERATMIFDKKSRLVMDPDAHIREAWEGVYYY